MSDNMSIPKVPPLPDSYWGQIKINEDAAPIGTKVLAVINGVVRGQYTVNTPGKLGDKSKMEYLDVKGEHEDLNNPIKFYIIDKDDNKFRAKNTIPEDIRFEGGAIPEIELQFITADEYQVIEEDEKKEELRVIAENLKKVTNALIKYANR